MLSERGELRHFIKDQIGLNMAEWALIAVAVLLALPLVSKVAEVGRGFVADRAVEVIRDGTSAIFDRLLDPTKYQNPK